MTDRPQVYLIDDDEAVLDSLGEYLESEGFRVHRQARAEAVLDVLDQALANSCIVSDVRMPGLSGLDLQKELKRRGSSIPLILITGHGDIAMAVAAIKAGAHEFLEKPFDERRLREAIDAALATAEHHQASAAELADLVARRAELSDRQREVMDLAAKGRTNKEIGLELGISPRTVEIYRARVMERMGAKTLADLVRIAVKLTDRGRE